jgi:hypothetical protein
VRKELRGSNHNDPTVEKLVGDPAVKSALDARSKMDGARGVIQSVLETTDDRKLKGWVTVAVWEDESGKESETVLGDGYSTHIQQKGYLHSGVWVNAHAEP